MFFGEQNCPDQICQGHALTCAALANRAVPTLNLGPSLVQKPVAEVAINLETALAQFVLWHTKDMAGVSGAPEFYQQGFRECIGIDFDQADKTKRNHDWVRPPPRARAELSPGIDPLGTHIYIVVRYDVQGKPKDASAFSVGRIGTLNSSEEKERPRLVAA